MDRVTDPADPARCQGRAPDGQCWNRADICPVHTGGKDVALIEARRIYNLDHVRYRERLNSLAERNPVDALTKILALARLLKEKRLNLASRSPELFRDHSIINSLDLAIERLSKTLTTIEQSLTTLKGKSELVRAAHLIIQVCADELAGQEARKAIIDRISTQIIDSISLATNHSDIPIKLSPARAKVLEDPLFQINDPDDRYRLDQLAKNSQLRSLTEDIGIQVLHIEELWNSAKDDIELVQAASAILGHLKRIESLIKSSHETEEILGNLLSRETRQNLAQRISEIVVRELEHLDGYEEIVDRIWPRAIESFKQAANAAKRIA